MTQAILEITGMLLGALAIGVFFTYRYWKSKYEEVNEQNQELGAVNETLRNDLDEQQRNNKEQEASHKEDLTQLNEENKQNLAELQDEVKQLKADERAHVKSLKEEKKAVKELNAKTKALEEELELKNESLGEKERELEEITEHFKTHNISYYKQIDGKRYKAATLIEADEAIAGVGDGRISKADAEKIFATISDGHTYTQVEKDTMHYIREHYNWTPESDELFRKKVRSWAAKGHQLS